MSGCRPLSFEEENLVLSKFTRQRDKALFILGVKSGFRVSELLSLKVLDVYREGKILDRVRITTRNMKGKTREVALHSEAKLALLALIHVESLQSFEFLFKSRNGNNKPISRFQAWAVLKDAFREAELQGALATHTMRKSFCKRVHERLGNDLVKTQKAMGHSSIMSTIAYLPVDQDEIDAAVLA